MGKGKVLSQVLKNICKSITMWLSVHVYLFVEYYFVITFKLLLAKYMNIHSSIRVDMIIERRTFSASPMPENIPNMQQRYSPLNGAIHFFHQPICLGMVGGT